MHTDAMNIHSLHEKANNIEALLYIWAHQKKKKPFVDKTFCFLFTVKQLILQPCGSYGIQYAGSSAHLEALISLQQLTSAALTKSANFPCLPSSQPEVLIPLLPRFVADGVMDSSLQ